MSVRNYVSPWVLAIEKFTVDGVKKTISETCEKVTVAQLTSQTFEPDVSKVTAWYGVILYIKKRKKEYRYMQRNKQGSTIPIDNYSRFVVMQEIGSEQTVVMFVPGSTLSVNFFVQTKNCWNGSGVVLLDPIVSGVWNDNAVISTKHPFIPFDVRPNLHLFPKIEKLPHSFRFNQAAYQGFFVDDLDPPKISEVNLVPSCPNVFCDSNHGMNETCPAAVGTRCLKKNCLEAVLSLPSDRGQINIPFMSMDLTKNLVHSEIIDNTNRFIPITFLRKCVQAQLRTIRACGVKWFVIGWYRVKLEPDGLQSFVSKFHISKIGCIADMEAVKIPPSFSDLRPEHYFPDIYRTRILMPGQGEGDGLAVEQNVSELTNENLAIDPEIPDRIDSIAGEFARLVAERDKILSMNETVNRPLEVRRIESLLVESENEDDSRNRPGPSRDYWVNPSSSRAVASTSVASNRTEKRQPVARMVYRTKTGKLSKKSRLQYVDPNQTEITQYFNPTRRGRKNNQSSVRELIQSPIQEMVVSSDSE
jgi:hypothetical protein